MKPTFYLFRHGDTFATKKGSGYGIRVFSAPILPEAAVALEKMGQYLKPIYTDFNVSSAVLRCKQSAAIITAQTGKEFIFDKRLNEYFLESIGHFTKRLKNLLAEVEKNEYQHILICTHGACISALISLLTAKKDESISYNFFHYPPPGVLTIIHDTNIQEINFNTPV